MNNQYKFVTIKKVKFVILDLVSSFRRLAAMAESTISVRKKKGSVVDVIHLRNISACHIVAK